MGLTFIRALSGPSKKIFPPEMQWLLNSRFFQQLRDLTCNKFFLMVAAPVSNKKQIKIIRAATIRRNYLWNCFAQTNIFYDAYPKE